MPIKKIISSLTLAALILPVNIANAESIEDIGNGAQVFKTTANADTSSNISQILNFNFIKDNNYDKELLVLKTSGTIHSGYKAPNKDDYWSSSLLWGGQYNINVEVVSNDSANIIDYAPKNQNESHEVTNTVGYNIGGDINISSSPSGNSNAGYNFSETIHYQQENYKTSLYKKTNPKNVGWEVEANKIYVNGYGPYTRAKHHGERYGNELYLASRQGSVYAGANFVSPSAMPTLAKGNFNPEFISVISHRPLDNEKETLLKVTYERKVDRYENYWNNFHWWGQNIKNTESKALVATYKINWTQHTAKLVNQVER